MTFRARLTLTLVALATVPLLVVGYGVRREMRARLDEDAASRVRAEAGLATARLNATLSADLGRLRSLVADLERDNRFPAALADAGSAERRWLLDWGATAMRQSGLAVLQLQDSSGRILSSGHFRNDFDRVAPAIPPGRLASATVLDARTPEGLMRTLVTSIRFTARGASFTLTGGSSFDSVQVASLAADGSVEARLLPLDASTPSHAVAVATFAHVVDGTPDDEGVRGLQLVFVPDMGATAELKAGVTRWILVTLGATLLVAIALALLIGRLVSAPLVALAGRTASLDLDRLDQRFATGRDDEVGALEGTLDALASRLRRSVTRLREAERAAATGDLARQVNHDIKNGLAPIRNVLRHLVQVAERAPDSLAPILLERRGTLESSVAYLETLARNYARLSPALNHGPTDLRRVVTDVVRGVSAAQVVVDLPADLPPVRADAVVLQRILDNLVSNAVDALEGKPGSVTICATAVGDGDERRVRIAVADTGRGMTREELDRAFDDFHTTKPAGTGLGLSVVRRLLTDLGGSVRAETAPAEGTTFTVDIPAARFPA